MPDHSTPDLGIPRADRPPTDKEWSALCEAAERVWLDWRHPGAREEMERIRAMRVALLARESEIQDYLFPGFASHEIPTLALAYWDGVNYEDAERRVLEALCAP